jgi:hypothetical protein
MTTETKTCPQCGGVILAAAVKCKHCKTRFAPPGTPAATVGVPPPAVGVQSTLSGKRATASERATAKCPVCGSFNPSRASKCVRCGTPLKKMSRTQIAVIALAGVVVLGGAATTVVVVLKSQKPGRTTVASPAATPGAEETREDLESEARATRRKGLEQLVGGSPTESDCFTMQRDGNVPVDL